MIDCRIATTKQLEKAILWSKTELYLDPKGKHLLVPSGQTTRLQVVKGKTTPTPVQGIHVHALIEEEGLEGLHHRVP